MPHWLCHPLWDYRCKVKHSFCPLCTAIRFLKKKNFFSPQDSALFCNVWWTGLSTGTLPPSFTAKIKGKNLPRKPRWICGQGAACGSCSQCQIPPYEMIRWCDCWLLLLSVSSECSDGHFCWSVPSMAPPGCCWHCRQSPFLILTASWHALNELTWNKSKSHDFC